MYIQALLNRFADIEGEEYVQKIKGMPVFHMIGQVLRCCSCVANVLLICC
jgi:hypothetical protein